MLPFNMPLKVSLLSPRNRMPSVKVCSTVSVNSEFEYLNLPSAKSPRKLNNNRNESSISEKKRDLASPTPMLEKPTLANESTSSIQHLSDSANSSASSPSPDGFGWNGSTSPDKWTHQSPPSVVGNAPKRPLPPSSSTPSPSGLAVSVPPRGASSQLRAPERPPKNLAASPPGSPPSHQLSTDPGTTPSSPTVTDPSWVHNCETLRVGSSPVNVNWTSQQDVVNSASNSHSEAERVVETADMFAGRNVHPPKPPAKSNLSRTELRRRSSHGKSKKSAERHRPNKVDGRSRNEPAAGQNLHVVQQRLVVEPPSVSRNSPLPVTSHRLMSSRPPMPIPQESADTSPVRVPASSTRLSPGHHEDVRQHPRILGPRPTEMLLADNTLVNIARSQTPSASLQGAAEPQQPVVKRTRITGEEATSSEASHSPTSVGQTFLTVNLTYRSLSPSPPPPPPPYNAPPPTTSEAMVGSERLSSRGHPSEDSFPPPPSVNTLKRMVSYRRSDRGIRQRERKKELTRSSSADSSHSDREDSSQDSSRLKENRQEAPIDPRMNSSLSYPPSSPARDAAKGALGWEKFLGRSNSWRSVSANLTTSEIEVPNGLGYQPSPFRDLTHSSVHNQDQRLSDGLFESDAASLCPPPPPRPPPYREDVGQSLPEAEDAPQARSFMSDINTSISTEDLLSQSRESPASSVRAATTDFGYHTDDNLSSGEAAKCESVSPPPPLPPKPKQKISSIGQPNSENFIVIDNSVHFLRTITPRAFVPAGASADTNSMNTSVSGGSVEKSQEASLSLLGPAKPSRTMAYTSADAEKLLNDSFRASPPAVAFASKDKPSSGDDDRVVMPAESSASFLQTKSSSATAAILLKSGLAAHSVTPDPHSRSDSGLSSMSSWSGGAVGLASALTVSSALPAPSTTSMCSSSSNGSSLGPRSGSSSVRSSSIVSSSSSSARIDELLQQNHHQQDEDMIEAGEGRMHVVDSNRRSCSIVSSCSLRLQELEEEDDFDEDDHDDQEENSDPAEGVEHLKVQVDHKDGLPSDPESKNDLQAVPAPSSSADTVSGRVQLPAQSRVSERIRYFQNRLPSPQPTGNPEAMPRKLSMPSPFLSNVRTSSPPTVGLSSSVSSSSIAPANSMSQRRSHSVGQMPLQQASKLLQQQFLNGRQNKPSDDKEVATASPNGQEEPEPREHHLSRSTSRLQPIDDIEAASEAPPLPDSPSTGPKTLASGAVSSPSNRETVVQRQLDTIRLQKEQLIREIVENEKEGSDIRDKLKAVLPHRDLERYSTFLLEMEKTVLLLLSLSSRLQRAEEELVCGNLTDLDKHNIRCRRQRLTEQLADAVQLRERSDARQAKVEEAIRRHTEPADPAVLHRVRHFVAKREQLLREQRACEDSERSILSGSTEV